MNTISIGVDFQARQQTICYLTTETGELVTAALKHEPKAVVRTFYEQFSGQVIVASLYCTPGASATREVIAEVRTAGHALRVFRSHFLAQ